MHYEWLATSRKIRRTLPREFSHHKPLTALCNLFFSFIQDHESRCVVRRDLQGRLTWTSDLLPGRKVQASDALVELQTKLRKCDGEVRLPGLVLKIALSSVVAEFPTYTSRYTLAFILFQELSEDTPPQTQTNLEPT
jgi:hypothetical protein